MSRIALDLHMAGAQETGNETYAVQLAYALGRLGGHEYLGYTPAPDLLPRELVSVLRVRRFRNAPSAVRIAWLYPWLMKRDSVDLLHVQYVAPPLCPCPTVVTVHDVTYRLFPDHFPARVRMMLDLLVGPSIRRAARVIVPSECTRQDLLREYDVPPGRVVVTPEAAAPDFSPQTREQVDDARHRFGIGGRYVLAVGNLQPRKNLLRLIDAFVSLAAEFSDLELVLVGRRSFKATDIEANVRAAGIGGRVRFTGYVSRDDLASLYTGATVFCYPSLYEGFGLPVLEAMACGAPTVTSNVSSLPEVAGEAALLVDPLSAADIARALRALIESKDAQGKYAALGRRRAAKFSWDKTARLTRQAYEDAVGLVAREPI